MKKLSLFTALIFLTFSFLYSQNKENEVSLKIRNLIEQQEGKIRSLYKYRRASQDWIKTSNINEKYITEALFTYNKNVGILVYSYDKGALKVNLFSRPTYENKSPLLSEFKKKINIDTLNSFIKDVNFLFSQTFLNRAPQKRGTIVKNRKKKEKKLLKSFKKLNKIILPEELQLSNFEHLIIVSTLNISTLPFSAFNLGDEYLIDKMSYSVAPNIFELFVSKRRNLEFEKQEMYYFWEDALFVSNPKYPNNLEWSFPDLPGAEVEVNYVINKSKPKKSTKLFGENATKSKILKNICYYDLIYFATHGITDSKDPMDKSFLVLANEEGQNGYITLREIMNLRKKCELKADLVVLSACQTGLGKAHKGGTIGLARAFQIAGANHVLMSLWNIDDMETATIMKLFFDELEVAKELMPHSALRNAILKYKKDVNDDPKYWAAFSLFGVPY